MGDSEMLLSFVVVLYPFIHRCPCTVYCMDSGDPMSRMTRIRSWVLPLLLVLWPATGLVSGYSPPPPLVDRRTAVVTATTASVTLVVGSKTTPPAWAVDSAKPAEFQNVGRQAPAPDGQAPFETLSNG
eukprot:scaffold38963_cov221-Amphora_coffeaeformis.AAC.1